MAFKMKGFSGFYGKSPIKQLKPFSTALEAKKSFGKNSLDLTSMEI